MLHLLRDPIHQNPHPAKSLTLFAWMVDCVRIGLAEHAATPRTPRVAALLRFVWFWLLRASRRMDALYTRWQQGKYKPAPPRPSRARAPRTPSPDAIPLRRGHAWLLKLAQRTAIGQAQVALLLEDADFTAFLQAVPAARRIFRPICRMTGAPQPDWLAIPTRPRKPGPQRPPKPPREGSRAWYETLNTRPDGTQRYWPDCYGPRRWAFKKPA